MPEEGITPPAPLPTPPNFGDPKMWYESSELWVAIIALVAYFFQMFFGFVLIPPELQMSIAVVLMALLRGFKTNNPVAWTKKQFARMNGVA